MTHRYLLIKCSRMTSCLDRLGPLRKSYVHKHVRASISSLFILTVRTLRFESGRHIAICCNKCCQRYTGHVLLSQTMLQNDIMVQRSFWRRSANFFTTYVLYLFVVYSKCKWLILFGFKIRLHNLSWLDFG